MDKNIKDVLKAAGVGAIVLLGNAYLAPKLIGLWDTGLKDMAGPLGLGSIAIAGLAVFVGKMLVDKIDN